jgi:solute carrier family 25 (mitochondrial folate transporter), member 32
MEFVYGFCANLVSTTICHPIDVIKTNYQINKSSINNNIKNIYDFRGVKGFYRGLGTNILTFPIFWGVYFQTNKIAKEKNINPIISYYIAGMIGSFIANPFFVIKTRVQLHNIPIIETIKTTYKNGGIYSFYRGLNATLLNNSKLGIQFPLYDYLKDNYMNVPTASLISKVISTSILYPMDLIRVKQRSSDIPISILKISFDIFNTNGFRGFYRGIILYNMISTPNFVIMMCTMEYIKNH